MMTKHKIKEINIKNFWQSDLNEIEAAFLNKKEKITDLPTKLAKNVPHQGSVLLRNIINVDKMIKKPSFASKIKYLIFNK